MLPYLFYKNCADMLYAYDGSVPFHLYLKEQFKEHKNWGSKDRKRYRACCYFFWRNAVGVSRNTANDILEWLQSHYTTDTLIPETLTIAGNDKNNDGISVDRQISGDELISNDKPSEPTIHPYHAVLNEISVSIDHQTLQEWFREEPPVWLRATNGKTKAVLQQLQKLNITVLQQSNDVIAVTAQANLNPITDFGYAYIQDIGSQMAMDWRDLPLQHMCNPNHSIWDCCCGAGGKAITLLQNYPKANVTCSDVRANILENLQKRFQSLQLSKPKTQVIDLQNTAGSSNQYDMVMADVPCSGSGTWRRNPENIHFFSPLEINMYANKQLSIINNAQQSVKLGGYLVYMTCSVFRNENEMVIEQFIEKHEGFEKVDEKYCGGHQNHGDYIYRAILQRVR
jgi:16S rRNA (cytosine967-C5)-methyltransferase